jgi:hypothetical protein
VIGPVGDAVARSVVTRRGADGYPESRCILRLLAVVGSFLPLSTRTAVTEGSLTLIEAKYFFKK